MAIWKLAPVLTSISDSAWAFTRWYGAVLVRAANPKDARKIAAEAFRELPEGENDRQRVVLESPWLNDELVACRRVAVSTYPPEGPDHILQPHVGEYLKS